MGPPKIIITYYVYDFNLTSVQCSMFMNAECASISDCDCDVIGLAQTKAISQQFRSIFDWIFLFIIFVVLLLFLYFVPAYFFSCDYFTHSFILCLRTVCLKRDSFFLCVSCFWCILWRKKVLLLCSRNWNSCDRKR